MKKAALCLCSLIVAVAAASAVAQPTVPQTPALVPAPSLVASAEQVLDGDLKAILERRRKAEVALTAANAEKTTADAAAKKLDDQLKDLMKKRDVLKTAIETTLPAERAKVAAAFQAWTAARDDCAAAAGASPAVLDTAKKEVTKTSTALKEAQKRFAAYAKEAGVTIREDCDPLFAAEAFTQTLETLNRAIADLTPKAAQAKAKADSAAAALQTAAAEEKAAREASQSIAGDAVTRSRLQNLGSRTVELAVPPVLTEKLAALTDAVNVRTDVTTLQGRMDALQKQLDTFVDQQTKTNSGLTARVEAAEKTLVGHETRLKAAEDSIAKLQSDVQGLQKQIAAIPAPPDVAKIVTDVLNTFTPTMATKDELKVARDSLQLLQEKVEAAAKASSGPRQQQVWNACTQSWYSQWVQNVSEQ